LLNLHESDSLANWADDIAVDIGIARLRLYLDDRNVEAAKLILATLMKHLPSKTKMQKNLSLSCRIQEATLYALEARIRTMNEDFRHVPKSAMRCLKSLQFPCTKDTSQLTDAIGDLDKVVTTLQQRWEKSQLTIKKRGRRLSGVPGPIGRSSSNISSSSASAAVVLSAVVALSTTTNSIDASLAEEVLLLAMKASGTPTHPSPLI